MKQLDAETRQNDDREMPRPADDSADADATNVATEGDTDATASTTTSRSTARIIASTGDSPVSKNAAPVAVSIEHLSKIYPVPLARLKHFFRRKSAAPVEALNDISFNMREGEVFGLIGRNGAGKTTLAKIIATLVQPTGGTVTVRGHDSVRDEERVRSFIGLASAEERSFYWRLTAVENLTFFARLYGLPSRAARVRIAEILSLVELEEVARRRFGELSTGNKQRMAVARALLNHPPVLLLDEPTRSLDPVAAARMRALISRLAHADPPTTILLTSHNLNEIEELCSRIAIISRGRIRALDTPDALRAQHRQQERITLTLDGISRERAAGLLSQALGDIPITTAERAGHSLVSMLREPSDALLDRAMRTLFEGGAMILDCHVERGSLLDVLEIYEREEKEEKREEAGRMKKGKTEKEERR